MEIKTKFNIGDEVLLVSEDMPANVTKIIVTINKKGKISVRYNILSTRSARLTVSEEELIPFKDVRDQWFEKYTLKKPPKRDKRSYQIQSYSTDITFCTSYCENFNCDRNTRGELFKRADCLYSISAFGDFCTDKK